MYLAEALYEASLDPGRWPAFLSGLAGEMGAHTAALAWHDFDTAAGQMEFAVGLDKELQQRYGADLKRVNPWLQNDDLLRSQQRVLRGADLPAAEPADGVAFARKFLEPASIGDTLLVVLDRRDERCLYIVLGRPAAEGPFPAETVQQLTEQADILAQAYQSASELARTQRLWQAGLDALNGLSLGVIVLNGKGGAIAANRQAQAIIDSGDALHVVNGGLSIDRGGRRVRVKELLQQLETSEHADEVQVLALAARRVTGQRPLTLMMTPVADGVPYIGEDLPHAILYIGDPERATTIDPVRIQQLYGLSRAESRVAALLASGYRLDQTAEMLGVAYETVRKHLKQIFGKTGTYRQAELVRIIVTGPAGLTL